MTRTARVLAVAAITLIGGGGALIYVGSRSHGQPPFEKHLPTRSTTSDAGFAVGRMHITGGPRPPSGKVHDRPLPGAVEVHRAGDPIHLVTMPIGTTGQFRIELAAGTYQLVGLPANSGIDSFRSQVFTIIAGRTTPVDLVDVAT